MSPQPIVTASAAWAASVVSSRLLGGDVDADFAIASMTAGLSWSAGSEPAELDLDSTFGEVGRSRPAAIWGAAGVVDAGEQHGRRGLGHGCSC